MNGAINSIDYGQLFTITIPETILEVVSLLILIVDLGLLRRSSRTVRMASACLLGVAASAAAAVWLLGHSQVASLVGDALVATPLVAAAQIGILLLTALVLLLSLKAEFTRNPSEFVAIVLLAATGMLLVTAARDLLVIFVALELLSLSLYVLTAFAKSSAQSAVGWLIRRKLLVSTKTTVTATPEYTVLTPWRNRAAKS